MRFQYLLHIVAGGLLAAPAVIGADGDEDALAGALDQTVRTIEVLAGVQADLAAGDAGAIADLRALTEAAPAEVPAAQRESALERLRRQVAELDQKLAELEARPPAGAAAAPPQSGVFDPLRSASGTTAGLSEAQRQALRAELAQTPSEIAAASLRRTVEPEGYVADPLRLGRALYRAGEHAAALAALQSQIEVEPEALYWTARAQEKLGRAEAALASYAALAELDASSPWARQAAHDAEFLRWQVDFSRRLEQP